MALVDLIEIGKIPEIKASLTSRGGTRLVADWRDGTQSIGGGPPPGWREGEFSVGVIDVAAWTSLDDELRKVAEDDSLSCIITEASFQIVTYHHFPYAILIILADMNVAAMSDWVTKDMESVHSAMRRLIQGEETIGGRTGNRGPVELASVRYRVSDEWVRELGGGFSEWAGEISKNNNFITPPPAIVRKYTVGDRIDKEDEFQTAYVHGNESIALAGSVPHIHRHPLSHVRVDLYSILKDMAASNAIDPVPLWSSQSPIAIMNAKLGSWVIPAACIMWVDNAHSKISDIEDELVEIEDYKSNKLINTALEECLFDSLEDLRKLALEEILIGEYLNQWPRPEKSNGLISRIEAHTVPWAPTLDQRGERPTLEPFHVAQSAYLRLEYEYVISRLDRYRNRITSLTELHQSKSNSAMTQSIAMWTKVLVGATIALIFLAFIQLIL